MWNNSNEAYLLKLLCFHKPVGENAEKLLTIIENKLNEKFESTNIKLDDIKSKINEYYDLKGLSELNITNTIDEVNVENKKQTKHVVIDEDKNKVFGELSSEKKMDNEKYDKEQEIVSNTDNLEQKAELDKAGEVQPVAGNTKKLAQIETSKNEPQPSNITAHDDLPEEEVAEKNDEVIVESKDDHKTEKEVKAKEDMSTQPEKDRSKEPNEKDENKKKKMEEDEIVDAETKDNKDAYVKDEAAGGNEEEEEPAHLTRSQARKLHIDIQKETEQNEKKTLHFEETRRKSMTRNNSTDEGTQYKAEDDISDKDVSIHVITDEELSDSTPRRRGRRRLQMDDLTPRRSTRLNRKSIDSDSEAKNGKVETSSDEEPTEFIGRRTRSSSNTRNSESGNDDDPLRPLSKGRKRSTTNDIVESTTKQTRRTRSLSKHDDSKPIDTKNTKEAVVSNAEEVESQVEEGLDNDNSDGNEEGKDKEVEEEQDETNDEEGQESEQEESSAPRRSLRKRSIVANDDTIVKKQKAESPDPSITSLGTPSVTPTPKRRGRKPKSFYENSETEQNTPTRRSTRR